MAENDNDKNLFDDEEREDLDLDQEIEGDAPDEVDEIFDGEEDSGTIVNRFLFVRDLEVGTHIQLAWVPDRQLTIRYEGEELFTVVESVRGKLRPGDTFTVNGHDYRITGA